MTVPMAFRCRVHGTVSEYEPSQLMSEGRFGCTICSREKASRANRLNAKALAREVVPTLPEHIELKEVTFDEQSRTTLLMLDCKHHGVQRVSKGYLSSSPHKCPACGRNATGYASHRLNELVRNNEAGAATNLVILEVEVFGIRTLKVGITTRKIADRYQWYAKEIHFVAQLPERDAIIIEQRIKSGFSSEADGRILKAGMRNGKRWSGDRETPCDQHRVGP